ncbi:MAG: hypothetical protein PHS30_04055, partial [Bacteroidales bacterium]|nr:hypothetical protein [Bacteroidales bacterium]
GRVLITLDNVEGKLRAPTLASLLTSSMYQGRILGKSEMVTFPNRTVWIANGNNIQLGGDLPRRCYTVKLDAKSAQPWLRKIKFKHPDLRGWVYENRGWIVNAIITITRAWIRDNKPVPDNQVVLGGFEEWCNIIGGVLNYAGITGFLGNLEDMYENMDQDTIQWESFLLAWYECYGNKDVGVAEIYDRLKHETNSNESLFKDQALYSSLPDWLGDEFNKKSSFVRKLGKALSKKDGVCYSCGLKLVRGITKRRAVMWSVVVWDNELWELKVGENNG